MNAIDVDKHKQVWNSARTTKNYAAEETLQLPEQRIIEILKDQLPHMRMLDLGIGGGRTTLHYAPLVKEYVGSDYAENMVTICRERFHNAGAHVSFEQIDATDMSEVPDNSFDFVLFSYNSIDCVEPEDRVKVFQEARRVGKKGGYFAFSSHNIQYIDKMYTFKWHKNLRDFLYQFYRLVLLVYYNGFPGKYLRMNETVFRDGVERFSISLYYSKPDYQMQQLREQKFKNIRAFSVKTGKELTGEAFSACKEAWIYYLCEI
ncbi:MAG: class I SAM-dependent methyltransferase [Saprospiraceae bacterium]|nr:class I SAM-dependent methyltransferase [Saprospiraceae bacterium]